MHYKELCKDNKRKSITFARDIIRKKIMKAVIFNQRVTVFTNSNNGYSDNIKDVLISKLGDIKEMGMSPNSFAVMVGPQQIVASNQIPQGAPWFFKVQGIRVEMLPNKIDIISDKFINTQEEENGRIEELINVLKKISEAISLEVITRIAYAPSFGLDSVDEKSAENYWNNIIAIKNVENSKKQEMVIRYNTPCTLNFCQYSNVITNRVVTINAGQRMETKINPIDGKAESRSIECVIVSIDINTNDVKGTYSIDESNDFCNKAQVLGRELLDVINIM